MQKLKRPWGMGTRTYSQSAQYIRRRMALCPCCGHLHCCGQLEPKSDAAAKSVASNTAVAFQVPDKAIECGCHCLCGLCGLALGLDHGNGNAAVTLELENLIMIASVSQGSTVFDLGSAVKGAGASLAAAPENTESWTSCCNPDRLNRRALSRVRPRLK
jgi:hypothetical protein